MKDEKEQHKNISLVEAAVIFLSSTAYFYLLLIFVYPYLKSNLTVNPALYWFITGFLLFVPLFVFSVLMVRKEGNRSFNKIIQALYIKKLSGRDWYYSITGLILIFLLSGLIYGISWILNWWLGIGMIDTQPWFMDQFRPFKCWEILLLLVWLAMFFFNIAGEEILWRGYIQARLNSKYSWLWCCLLWAVFHLPFGLNIILMASPALIIIPYIFSKTKNTTIGIFIHGLYNGPIFIAISLGLLN
ncbi:MAG: hypothetical protein APR63_11195 [Desulfuromonas sp. SDB]|nr:MAG: hypothetical protein APR63_11195 [Desulfuromonas sp. SDB]